MCVVMVKYILCLALLVGVCAGVKEYRIDYKYNRKTDAYYKLHTESVRYDTAKVTCEMEGAKLMRAFPSDVAQAHLMLKEFPDIGDFIWAGDDGLSHELAEDERVDIDMSDQYTLDKYLGHLSNRPNRRLCEVIMRQGEVFKYECYFNYPFIYKVEAKDIYSNPQCNVFSGGYQYVESVGSCYKISDRQVTWNQAYAECQEEGAHLLILNSDLERQAVHNLTRSEPNFSNDNFLPGYIAGIRVKKIEDDSPLVFKTIFGQTLEEAGYAEWCPEANNWDRYKSCGSISKRNGKYSNIGCDARVAFICEKEVTGKRND